MKTWWITVDGVPVEVTRKPIKHFHLKIHRHDGRVLVSAPRAMTDGMIRAAVTSRLAWIHRHLEKVAGVHRAPPPSFVTGEPQYFQGRACALRVTETPGGAGARLRDDIIELRIRPGSDAEKRRAVLEEWYRAHLQRTLPDLVGRWEAVMGVAVAECRVKRMKTRWGTCNPVARRIWLNLELAKRPPECLEYVVVHEMAHLLERRHNARFHGLMDRFLPDWRSRRDILNTPPSPAPDAGKLTADGKEDKAL